MGYLTIFHAEHFATSSMNLLTYDLPFSPLGDGLPTELEAITEGLKSASRLRIALPNC